MVCGFLFMNERSRNMYLYLYNESKFFLKEMYSLWVLDISLEEDYLLAGSWLLL